MRSNSSSCIIRWSTLDNMFRNSKQCSPSPPLQFDAAAPAIIPHSLYDGYANLPVCRQLMDIDAHPPLHSLDPPPDPAAAHFIARSSKPIDMPCPMNANMHTHCTSAAIELVQPQIVCTHDAPSKEIREYDFLRCMEEGPRPALAHDDVDCTLHLGTVPCETAVVCDAGIGASVKEVSKSMQRDRRAASSRPLFVDRISTSPSFGGETQTNGFRGREIAHPYLADKKEYNVGALHWGSSSSSIIRSSMEGACAMSTLLRENTHDIDECGSSSRTSSNSSGNTIRASAGMNESSFLHNYVSNGPRDKSESYPKQWFQDGFAGALSSPAVLAGSRLRGNEGYRNAAAGQGGGPFTPNVFSGSNKSSSNAKETSNYVMRICAQCKTMRTPLWRNGPQGPKSLCNACGIRYKKEERRSAAVEDSKLLHQPDPPDQRPRSSPTTDRVAEDPRPSLTAEDQLSRFSNDNRRSRLIADTLGEDQRPKFVDIAYQPSRFPAAREKRPKFL